MSTDRENTSVDAEAAELNAATERVRRDWQALAGGEPVRIQYIKGAFYGYCSELIAYRIERHYNCRPKCQAGHSEAQKSWYVCLETAPPVSATPQRKRASDLGCESAFPHSDQHADTIHTGLTKREYFAIEAMKGLLAAAEHPRTLARVDSLAHGALIHADALLSHLAEQARK